MTFKEDQAILGLALLRIDNVVGPVCEWGFAKDEWANKEDFYNTNELTKLFMIAKVANVPESIEYSNVTTVLSRADQEKLVVCFLEKKNEIDYKNIWRRLRIISGKAKGSTEKLKESLQRLKEKSISS